MMKGIRLGWYARNHYLNIVIGGGGGGGGMAKLDTTWANKKVAFWRSHEVEMGQKSAERAFAVYRYVKKKVE